MIELLVVLGVLAIIFAIAVPNFLRSKMTANEASASATLRSLFTIEATWRQTDTDRNSIADYWTGDVSGLYRIEVSPAGSGRATAQVDAAVASADDNKLSAGNAVAGAVMPDSGLPAASLTAFVQNAPKSGYLYRAIANDLSTVPVANYRADPDNNGQDWTNTARFGFQARPSVYNSTGINTFIVNEAGVIYRRDFGQNVAGNASSWPAANPSTFGWAQVQ
ncbi:MAG: DUF2950 family protein [Planctomycetes bacterium]|nr:DUF2950 family protein [Planctomycetota bacterium]